MASRLLLSSRGHQAVFTSSGCEARVGRAYRLIKGRFV
jgi:hypothetical protein